MMRREIRNNECRGVIMLLTIIVAVVRAPAAVAESVNKDCLMKIGECLEDVETANQIVVECCPLIRDAISFDKSCFCHSSQVIFSEDATMAAHWDTTIGICSDYPSLEAACSDTHESATTASNSNNNNINKLVLLITWTTIVASYMIL